MLNKAGDIDILVQVLLASLTKAATMHTYGRTKSLKLATMVIILLKLI